MTASQIEPGRAMFQLPPELNDLKLLTRKIVKEQCIPLEKVLFESRMQGASGGGEMFIDGSIGEDNHARLLQISKETGIYTMNLPEKYGGSGFGVLGNFVVAEESNRSLVHLPVAGVPNILYEAEDDPYLRDNYLLPTMRGEKRACFAQTEPQAGSDPGNSMQTKAVRDGDDWVINGTKMFISGADTADFMMLQAVTDEEKRQRGGITMFLIDRDTPGITMSPIPLWLSSQPHQFFVYLDNVRVPNSHVLGEVGGGFRLGQRWLVVHDRISRGSLACGILSRGIDMAVEWAKNRVTFGQPLSQRQAIQWMLVDCFIDLKCIRAISYEAAARADAGEDVRVLGGMTKFMGANWGHRSIDKILQVFGGLGESLEMPITYWYRMLRHGRIGGGSDEIQYIQMSRAMFNIGSSMWDA